jgi:hypothetical protein
VVSLISAILHQAFIPVPTETLRCYETSCCCLVLSTDLLPHSGQRSKVVSLACVRRSSWHGLCLAFTTFPLTLWSRQPQLLLVSLMHAAFSVRMFLLLYLIYSCSYFSI